MKGLASDVKRPQHQTSFRYRVVRKDRRDIHEFMVESGRKNGRKNQTFHKVVSNSLCANGWFLQKGVAQPKEKVIKRKWK